MSADLAILCQSCGLCCDGSLFGRVPLGPEEVEPARRRGLRVLDGRNAFEQPCAALSVRETTSGTRRACSIYDDRPLSCRRFACRLHDRHRHEGGPLEPRLAKVRRVRELVADLEAQGLSPADFVDDERVDASRPDDLARQMLAELTKLLEDDFARA